MAGVAEATLKGVGKKVFARVEVMLDAGGKDVFNLGADSVTKSSVVASALLNRASELHNQVGHLSAQVDGMNTKLGAATDVVRQASEVSWWVNTWNGTVRHQGEDSRYNFLFRRWSQDEAVLGALRKVMSRDVQANAIPGVLPILKEGDVHLTKEAAQQMVRNIGHLQTRHAELSIEHAKLSSKLGTVKAIAAKWGENNTWFSTEWNNTARYRNSDYKQTRFREIWDAADGFRSSLKAALGV